jgi:hypothetical protein
MTRCSRLNDAEACGLSASLGEQNRSTNVYAMRGDAFHAGNAAHYRPNDPRFSDARAVAFGVLGVDDGADVTHMLQRLWKEWTPPEEARFEVPIAMDRNGLAVPVDSDKAITQGTADCVWIEGEFVVVVDFKSGARAEWNVPSPAENLQLLAYGFALADLLGKTKMKLGIYRGAEEVEGPPWLWAELDLNSADATAAWERVRGAALHDPTEAVLGPHCAECYSRLRCRAYVLPAVAEIDRDSALAPLSAGDDGVIEPQKLMRLLQACDAMDKLAEEGRSFAKAYSEKHGAIVIGDRQWGPIPVKGRESTSIAKLKASGLYERAVEVGGVTQGEPTKQYRWVKTKAA